jgi:hypothetical protein
MNDIKKFDPRVIALIVIALAVAGAIAYFGFNGAPPASPTAGPMSAETAALLEKLKEIGPVPDETPQIIVIQDAASAKTTQPFLENAQDGDTLFLFFEAKLALLYRPSTNEIIVAGPLSDGPMPAKDGTPAP